jgi:hypothetical protein
MDKIQFDFGKLKKVGTGKSLFEISSNGALIYFRYGKLTPKLNKKESYSTAWHGIRYEDLRLLSGKAAFICFVGDNYDDPILIPYNKFEHLFKPSNPSNAQYDFTINFKNSGTELDLPKVGKYNVDCYIGLSQLYEIRKKNDDVEFFLTDISEIEKDTNISETEKEQLISARKGQGLFRERVIENNNRCMVTGVAVQELLIASHIKPWKDSTNEERLDGNNGLLLSPHIDKLFYKNLISFTDVGRITVYDNAIRDTLEKWKIDPTVKYYDFSEKQQQYLAYHRKRCVEKIATGKYEIQQNRESSVQ